MQDDWCQQLRKFRAPGVEQGISPLATVTGSGSPGSSWKCRFLGSALLNQNWGPSSLSSRTTDLQSRVNPWVWTPGLNTWHQMVVRIKYVSRLVYNRCSGFIPFSWFSLFNFWSPFKGLFHFHLPLLGRQARCPFSCTGGETSEGLCSGRVPFTVSCLILSTHLLRVGKTFLELERGLTSSGALSEKQRGALLFSSVIVSHLHCFYCCSSEPIYLFVLIRERERDDFLNLTPRAKVSKGKINK